MQIRQNGYNPLARDAGTESLISSNRAPVVSSLHDAREMHVTTIRPTARRNPQSKDIKKEVVQQKSNKFVIRWRDDYNILLVNQDVIEYIKGQQATRESLEAKIDVLKKSRSKCTTVDEINSINFSMDEIRKEIDLMPIVSLYDYRSSVDHILKEYSSLTDLGPVIMGQKVKRDVTLMAKKTSLVDSYFEIAKTFCPMAIIKETRTPGLCPMCNGIIIDNGDYYACVDCNSVRSKMEYSEDGGENYDNTSKKSGYESGLNFKDLVLQFQIAYPVTIPDRVLESIKTALSQYQGFSMDKLTKADLVKVMKDLVLGAWYKHLNKIFYMLTGKVPMDISKYAANVIMRGTLFNEIYNEIKPDDRSNFLHGLHLFWLFLKNEGCEPNMDDFVLLKSRQVELANLETLRRGFDVLRKTHSEFQWVIYQIP